MVGLGAGTLAVYGRSGDSYRFFDINPAVIDIAWHDFRFLRESYGQGRNGRDAMDASV